MRFCHRSAKFSSPGLLPIDLLLKCKHFPSVPEASFISHELVRNSTPSISSPLWNAFTHASSDGQIWSRFHSNINVDSKWKLVSIQTHASSCWASWSLICFWYNAKSSFHRLLLCWSNISKLSLRLLSLSNWCDRIFTPVRISIEFTSLKLLVKVWVAFRGKRLFTETLLERNILTRRSKDLIPETSRGLLIIESGEK